MRIKDYLEILQRMQHWQKIIENVKEFSGSSPPSMFVGHFNYPKVFMGILSPPEIKSDADMHDFPEKWYQEKTPINQILSLRGGLIYARFKGNVKEPTGRLIETSQQIAMSSKPTGVEIELLKKPKFRFLFDNFHQPIGNPAPISKVRLIENPSVDKKVDYLVSDTDIRANPAAIELYKDNIPVSRIQKIFSAGLLGIKIQRKLVPTRWGITAVDDSLSKFNRERVKTYPEIDEIQLFHDEYIGNHYEVLLIPSQYQYELVEAWRLNNPIIGSDFESFFGRKEYATGTAGAFYTGRLAVTEHFEKIRRQGAALIIREIREDYYAAMGIWQMRESVRGALSNKPEVFSTVKEALQKISSRLIIPIQKIVNQSKLLKNLSEQRKLTKFFKR